MIDTGQFIVFHYADTKKVCCVQDPFGAAYVHSVHDMVLGEVYTVSRVIYGPDEGQQTLLNARVLRIVPFSYMKKLLNEVGREPEVGHWYEVIAD